MKLYRLATCLYAGDLSGTGSRLYGGRWNKIGVSMVYLASSKSLALLEVLVHLPPLLIPDNYCMSTFEIPEESVISIAETDLPSNWNNLQFQENVQEIGAEFVKKEEYLLCKVPSIVVGGEFNYLLNPEHPLISSVKIIDKTPFSFDERLF